MASRRIIIPGLTGRLQLRVLQSIGGFDDQAVHVAKTNSCKRVTTRTFSRQQSLDYLAIISQPAGCVSVLHTPAMLGGPCITSSMRRKSSLHSHCLHNSTQQPLMPITRQQQRQFSSRPSPRRGNKKKVDDNIPLLNEHLIAELFNRMKGRSGTISADTYEVRLLVEQGHNKKEGTINDDNNAASTNGENDTSTASSSSSTTITTTTPSSQLTTLNEAITIAHEHALDLMEVTLHVFPPVIKAVDFDKWQYEQKKKQAQLTSKKKKEGGGAISDRALKEFKFRAGIADHDLERKTNNMLKYLSKGHAIRVTLTARKKSLDADAEAIHTTLERVKELVGDRAIEARGLKANDRKSAGSLVFHPAKTKG